MIRVRQIKVPVLKDSEEYLKSRVAKKLRIDEKAILNYKINKKSIDARDKNEVFYAYEIDVCLINEKQILKKSYSNDIMITPNEQYRVPKMGEKKLEERIVIVGSGPAGLFAAYLLAENGFRPVIIERGEKIEDRVKTVEKFWESGILNENSNVQFGEGGAGTFSDGKLNTLTGDKYSRAKKVLETFVKFGAPEDISYLQKPHIGTDILREVIVNMRKAIINMGGDFYYNSCLTDLIIEEEYLKAIEVNQEKIIPCHQLILAIGHSARDTFEMLLDNNLEMQAKPFAIGMRVEHLQTIINDSQYGKFSNELPPASYKLTYTTKSGRGVYSFCMCPGGYVVNASSERGKLAINGMSNHSRDSKNANSALVVTISPTDFGNHPLDGIRYQRNLEEKAYKLGNGKIPLQLYKDYIENKVMTEFRTFGTEMKGEYYFTNLNDLFPDYINEAIKEAMPVFGRKIAYFDDENVILTGIESRTSSPVKIIRDENFESNIKGIYPCGEGAGYAGGITTAAIDGIKVAEVIIKQYSNLL